MLREELAQLRAQVRAIGLALSGEGEVARGEYAWTPALEKARELRALINTPEIIDFAKAVQLEAAHQRQRWPSEQDAGKTDADWFWLIGYLAGKALHNPGPFDPPGHRKQQGEKQLHRIITVAAAAANWHAARLGQTNMRPGIDTPAGEEP